MDPALAADLVLIVHVAWVLGAVLPVPLILLGARYRWTFVRNPVFRYVHLGMIGIVVVEALLGADCPLTVWENALRERAGQTGYDGSFIGEWLGQVLYYDLPPWFFTVLYLAFGALVVLLFVRIPPRPRARRGRA